MSPLLSWRQLACRHVSDSECLASFLAWQGAEVLAGVKPANLFNVLRRPLPCGRSMASLWQDYAGVFARRAGLKVRVLRETETRLLVLVYNPQMLRSTLAEPGVARALARQGYAEQGLGCQLDTLCRRMRETAVPHEIGFFLGYPAKDVRAFIGELDLPLSCRGPWVMYGDPTDSLVTARCFSEARERVRSRLAEAPSPCAFLTEVRQSGAAAA